MEFLEVILDFLIILMLLRLLIRPNEAYFHPIYRVIYRVTDPILLPFRYVTATHTQGVLLGVGCLVVLRGAIYMTLLPLGFSEGVGRSLLELLRLLFQVYAVMWVVGLLSGRGYGTPMIHMFARAFLPVDTVLRHLRVPPGRFHLAAFLVLWISYGILATATLSALILGRVPSPGLLLHGLGEGLLLIIRLFPFPGFFSLVLIVGALLSWVSPDPRNPVVQTIYGISEPLLIPFRRFLPHLGGLDFSPLIALLAFQILGSIAQRLLFQILSMIPTGPLT
jgi:YggT family protein